MAVDARAVGVSWRRRIRATTARVVPSRSSRSRPRRGRRRPAGFAPAPTVLPPTVWSLDRATVEAALEADWP